jgi:hypothetical protein
MERQVRRSEGLTNANNIFIDKGIQQAHILAVFQQVGIYDEYMRFTISYQQIV